MLTIYYKLSHWCRGINPLVTLLARFYMGWTFLRSGWNKTQDWEDTLDLFSDEWALPFLSPQIASVLGTAGEILFPLLLMLGIFTRVGALGLMCIVLVIELFIFPGTSQHYYWMLILGFLIAQGGGSLSLDRWLLNIKD